MNEENKARLTDLRVRVITSIAPLMDDETLDGEQRFLMALTSARTTGQIQFFEKALEVSTGIEDKDARADALMDLLGEIDSALEPTRRDEESTEVVQDHEVSDGNNNSEDGNI